MTRDAPRLNKAGSARLEVVDRLPRSPTARYALVDRKLQAIYEPPTGLPDCFRRLLEQLDQVWTKPDIDAV
jgi:hypothetical protein